MPYRHWPGKVGVEIIYNTVIKNVLCAQVALILRHFVRRCAGPACRIGEGPARRMSSIISIRVIDAVVTAVFANVYKNGLLYHSFSYYYYHPFRGAQT